MPRAFSQASKWRVARQLEGSVMPVWTMTPRTPDAAAMFTVSTSSSLVPTLPTCGKVKVMIWPA